MKVAAGVPLAGLLGCTHGSPGDSSAASPPAPEFGILADGVPGGAFLSAWTDGDVVRIVGGELDGSSGLLAVYDGESLCTEVVPGAAIWWIHGVRPGEWYAVGSHGLVIHSVNGVRTDETIPADITLYGVYVTAGDVWAVGGDAAADTGEVWRRQDGVWGRYTSTPGTAFKVWDGWVVGNGFAGILEAGAIQDHTPAEAPRLLTVRGRAQDDVWAVGGDVGPIVRRWDGTSWSAPEVDPYCVSRPLNGVWTGPDAPVWFAGMFGNVGGMDGDRWICPDFPPTQEHLHAAWPFGDEVLFVGGNLFSAGENYGTIVRYPAPAVPLDPSTCG